MTTQQTPPTPAPSGPAISPAAQELLEKEKATGQTGGTIQFGNTIYAKSEIIDNTPAEIAADTPTSNLTIAEITAIKSQQEAAEKIEKAGPKKPGEGDQRNVEKFKQAASELNEATRERLEVEKQLKESDVEVNKFNVKKAMEANEKEGGFYTSGGNVLTEAEAKNLSASKIEEAQAKADEKYHSDVRKQLVESGINDPSEYDIRKAMNLGKFYVVGHAVLSEQELANLTESKKADAEANRVEVPENRTGGGKAEPDNEEAPKPVPENRTGGGKAEPDIEPPPPTEKRNTSRILEIAPGQFAIVDDDTDVVKLARTADQVNSAKERLKEEVKTNEETSDIANPYVPGTAAYNAHEDAKKYYSTDYDRYVSEYYKGITKWTGILSEADKIAAAIRAKQKESGYVDPASLNLQGSVNVKPGDGKTALQAIYDSKGISYVPVIGTAKDARELIENWDKLTPAQRAMAITFTGISATGDVLLVAGGAGLLVKASSGASKGYIERLAISEGREAAGIANQVAKRGTEGKLGDLVVAASPEDTHLKQVAEFGKGIIDSPALKKKTVIIESSPLPSQAKAIKPVNDLLKAEGVNTKVVIQVDGKYSAKQIDETVKAIREAKPSQVEVRTITREGDKGVRISEDAAEGFAKNSKKVESGFKDTADKLESALKRKASVVDDAPPGFAPQAKKIIVTRDDQILRAPRDKTDFYKVNGREIELRPSQASGGAGTRQLAPAGGIPSGGGAAGTAVRESIELQLRRNASIYGSKAGDLLVVAVGGKAAGIVSPDRPPGFLPPAEPGIPLRQPDKNPSTAPTKPGTPARPEPDKPARPAPGPGEKPSTQPRPGPAPKPSTQPRPGPQPNPPPGKPGGAPRPIGVPKPTPEPSPFPKPQPKPLPKPTPAGKPEPKGQPKPTPGPGKPDGDPKPVPKPKPDPKPDPTPQPTPQPIPNPKTDKTVGGPGLPRFKLPDNKVLPPGRYPRVVRYPDGGSLVTWDLDTNKRTYERNTGDIRQSPRDGLKIITTDTTPPRARRERQGAFMVDITPTSIDFTQVARIGKGIAVYRGAESKVMKSPIYARMPAKRLQRIING